MDIIAKYLSENKIKLKNILLDPNNPRFAELGDTFDEIPESRYAEIKVQMNAFEKMKTKKFEVAELKDTIKTIGFLPIDRIIVRLWKGNKDNEDKKYILIEGNRRITALKWLIELHESGKETLSEELLLNFTEIEVLLLDYEKAPNSSNWIIPGLRHVSGIKEWGPYQKARAVFILREKGADPKEAAQSLGLSTRAANQLWRSFLGLEQMKKDEDFGEHVEPKQYSYFEEIFKNTPVRDWLVWSDMDRKFLNKSNLRELYTWIIGEEDDDGNLNEPKLPEAKSIRELKIILTDEAALSEFRSEKGTITRALARYEVDNPEDWQPVIVKAESVLASLSPDTLRSLSEKEIFTINKLSKRITSVLVDREKLNN